MTDAQFASAMSAIPPTLFALAALLNSLRNSKKITEATQAAARIEVHTNGMQKELQAASKAEGKREEKGEEAIRQAERDRPSEVVVVNTPAQPIPVEPATHKP